MKWLKLLEALLILVGFVAKRAGRRDVEKAVLNELEILHGKRVRGAADARDDVLSGRVSVDEQNDPNRRD
jgi:hypothetical protein